MSASAVADVEAMKKLANVIDGYFTPSYLFDVYHASWRRTVSPLEDTAEYNALQKAEDGTVRVAPLVRFSSLTAYSDVQSAAKKVNDVEDIADDALIVLVKTAITDHCKLISVVEDPALGLCVRRNTLLSESDNPIHRTVHMKPIHQAANDVEVKSFVTSFLIANAFKDKEKEAVEKLITHVSKRSMIDVSANAISRTVFYAQIEFVSKEIAELFVKLKPSYVAKDELVAHYLPPLKVKMLLDHQKEFEDIEARREAERNRNQLFRASQAQEQRQETRQVIASKLATSSSHVANNGNTNGSSDAPATVQVTEQFLTPGKTLKIPSLPPNVTWRDVKIKLSNLFPDEKRLIRVVKEENGSAYVVLFSPEKLEPLLSAWASETYIHNIIPSLVKVEGEEEKWAMAEYPSWVSGFVTKKVVKNAKFAAKRQRE